MTTCTNVGTLVMETPGGHAVSSFSGLNSRSAFGDGCDHEEGLRDRAGVGVRRGAA